jgi:ferredoxin
VNISTDQQKCVAAGVCVALAPTVFDQRDTDGKVVVLDDSPSDDVTGVVREAAESCPAFAITVTD